MEKKFLIENLIETISDSSKESGALGGYIRRAHWQDSHSLASPRHVHMPLRAPSLRTHTFQCKTIPLSLGLELR